MQVVDITPPQQPPDNHKVNWLWFLLYVIFYLIIVVAYIAIGM